ncbi:polysaccharide pyruvyl transferase family protein [Azospirillum sp. SYSU D00513]|uniref:polysaccharide pyruvyl transferase family protein n=1 Tax=Azospirillum sp. SYSU D00513 TaxID=2812561 RepID=UPI001A973B13|nr:polysaccharide pyruvyl transferase family protein [Azospirillum sp. SYSU D00513]
MTVIGISGSYGGLNVGDEAILTSAVEQLRMAVPGVEIVVFTRNAEHTRLNHAVDRVVCPRDAMRDEIIPEVRRLDLLLLGGGGILYDSEAQTYLREVVIAQQYGIPTHTFAIGVGPLKDQMERSAVRDGLNRMGVITVREQSAKRLIEETGVSLPVTVTADPALLLTPEPFTREMLAEAGIPGDRRLVGMSVREVGAAAPDLSEAAYHQLLAEAADFIVERFGAEVVFVPMERADLREAHRVMGRMSMPDRAHLLGYRYRPRQILGLMQHFEMAVGMRLHFLVFAAVTGTPLIALPYASKVYDFLASLGLSPRATVAHSTVGTFLADLDRLWDHRAEQTGMLRERVPELRERARRTVPLVTRAVTEPGTVAV